MLYECRVYIIIHGIYDKGLLSSCVMRSVVAPASFLVITLLSSFALLGVALPNNMLTRSQTVKKNFCPRNGEGDNEYKH